MLTPFVVSLIPTEVTRILPDQDDQAGSLPAKLVEKRFASRGVPQKKLPLVDSPPHVVVVPPASRFRQLSLPTI